MGGSAVKVAVYNRHWRTLGGGEQLAGGLATVLARDHDVELLVDEPFDPVVVSERLGFDLTSLPQRELPLGSRAFLDVTSEYDVLVNSSFSSIHPSRAAHSLYYVHFPVPYRDRSRVKRVVETVTTMDPLSGSAERETGFGRREFSGQGSWTDGNARMDLVLRRGAVVPFSFRMNAKQWPPGARPRVEVTVGDERVFSGVLDTRHDVRVRTTVTGRGVDDPIPVRIKSDVFVPRFDKGSDDDRELGIVVSHVRLGRRLPELRPHGSNDHGGSLLGEFVPEFLDSYQTVAANSEYTAQWVERLWGRTATVLAPPVSLRRAGAKRSMILAVGRFFPNSSGHSKKQLELVHAFRLACESGLEGWELCLAGGCKTEERSYVEDVRRAAVGLPVSFHVNARGEDVDELFASARLFWHGSGLGEDAERHPDRLEHFGITVVEAMSAGAVPIVFAKGGPAAIVRAARCGRVYSTVEELARLTLDLVAAPGEIDALSEASVRGSAEFTLEHFGDCTRALVATLLEHSPRTRGLS
jgi:glycosyltransferase involved in cell wall biosynthesis